MRFYLKNSPYQQENDTEVSRYTQRRLNQLKHQKHEVI